ncbi:MAG: M48 family metallopeptidase [Bacteroidales bacterium]
MAKDKQQYIINHSDLGQVFFTKKQRIRSIRIVVKGSQLVHISYPSYILYNQVRLFLTEKINWIKKTQEKIRIIEKSRKHFSIEEIAVMRNNAKNELPSRVTVLAQKYGFLFNKISVKNMFTRWGSCSSLNNLNFSLYLMCLPDELIDYVILHELCHTKHRNHGEHFWALLDFCTSGQSQQLSQQIKAYGKLLF